MIRALEPPGTSPERSGTAQNHLKQALVTQESLKTAQSSLQDTQSSPKDAWSDLQDAKSSLQDVYFNKAANVSSRYVDDALTLAAPPMRTIGSLVTIIFPTESPRSKLDTRMPNR